MAENLDVLSASYQVFYHNLRGFHWNLKGEQFFTLHEVLEKLYTDTQLKIDVIAERIVFLGGEASSSPTQILAKSKVKEAKHCAKPRDLMEKLFKDFETLNGLKRDILKLCDEIGDGGTDDMISGFLSESEKHTWMIRSWLGE